MNSKSILPKISCFYCIFLLCISSQSFAGIGYYPQYDYDKWGFAKSDYGEPKKGYGYKAPLVTIVQEKLKERGYDPGTIDGSWGDMTKNALILFQKELGISKTGWIDLKTRDLLFGQVHLPVNLVKKVQKVLQDNDFSPGLIDGLWGERTENALRQYQKKHGLRETGLLDSETRKIILEEK